MRKTDLLKSIDSYEGRMFTISQLCIGGDEVLDPDVVWRHLRELRKQGKVYQIARLNRSDPGIWCASPEPVLGGSMASHASDFQQIRFGVRKEV